MEDDAHQIRLRMACAVSASTDNTLTTDARRQPEQLAVAGDVAEVLQREQIASCGSARQSAAGAGLAGRQARIRVVKAFDDRQPLFKPGDPVALSRLAAELVVFTR